MNQEWLAQKALKRIVTKLKDEKILRDLHLKHYHMATSQFKKRTSHLKLPSRIYDLYDMVVKRCQYCNENLPQPPRSRISGLRAERFADLIFLDHGMVDIHGRNSIFLLILDAATSYLTAYPCLTSSATEVIQKLHEWMDTYQATPKAVCGDMAFHSPHDLKEFYRFHNIRPLPTGPHTPWPNRAETAVRLFKGFLKAMVERLSKEQALKNVTAAQMMRKAATIRNTQITFSGKHHWNWHSGDDRRIFWILPA